MGLPEQLESLQRELKQYFTANGRESQSLKADIAAMQRQVDGIDTKLAAHAPGSDGETGKSLKDLITEDEGFSRLLRDKKGSARINLNGADSRLLEQKTTITSTAVGFPTSGVLPIGRLPGITSEARQQLTLRDLLTASPTTFQVLDFVKVLSPMTIASPVAEASTKPENQATFTTVSERVKTIATWIPASRQILDDMSELMTFLQTMMPYYVNLAEEQEMLSGDSTGEHLHGLLPQATAFSVGLLSATKGWNKLDIIGRAIQQITAAKELQPTFIVLHPNDWWDIRLTKDGFGRYLLSGAEMGALTNTGFGVTVPTVKLFDLTVVPTVSIAAGTWLVGSGSPIAVEIRDRMEMQVEVSTEHASFFTQNMVAVRAEKRVALVTRRPGAFLAGSFSSSPA